MSEGIFREAGREEDGAIRAVLADAFPDNPKARPEMTAWQYWDNPFGQAHTWAYEDDGRVVAVYTGVPVPVRVGGRRGLAALGIDAAVAPSHQGRRLFTALSRGLYDHLGQHGMDYTLAFPNSSSHRGITRAGWMELAQLRVNVAALSPAWIAGRFQVPQLAARAALGMAFRISRRGLGRRCEGVPSGIDTLWERCRSQGTESGLVRDAAWWGWRYGAHPDAPYHYYETRSGGALSGAAVTRTVESFGGRFAYVLELLAADVTAACGLLGAIAAAEGPAEGADGIALVAVAGSSLDRLARAAGLRRLPRRLEPYPLYFGAVSNRRDVPDPSSFTWSVAWGDLDHL